MSLLLLFLCTFSAVFLVGYFVVRIADNAKRKALKERLELAAAKTAAGIFQHTLEGLHPANANLIVWYTDREGVLRCPHCHHSLQGDANFKLTPPFKGKGQSQNENGQEVFPDV